MKRDGDYGEPKYKPAEAAVVALVRPVMAVRRADHLGLGWAWLVHVAGIILAAVALLLLAGYESSGINSTLSEVLSRSFRAINELQGELNHPRGWAALAASVIFIEASVMLLAVVCMAWCSREEKIGISYVRALRRLMLLTPHAAVMVGVIGTALVWVRRSQWLSHTRVRIIDYALPLGALVFAGGCLWALWVVLRALGCRPASSMCRWPARCEGCGYQLAGLRRDRSCPECGLAIAKTLDKAVRTGTATMNGLGKWLSVTYQAVRRPSALGKRLQVMSSDTGHQRLLTVTLILVLMTVPAAMAGALILDRLLSGHVDLVKNGVGEVIVAGTVLGLMMIATTAGAALMIAGLTGVLVGWRQGRNLMPAAMRAACYLSGFAVIWSLVFWCSMAVFLVVMSLDMLTPLAARYNIASEKIVFFWHYAVASLGLLIYGTLIERATKAARNANW